MEQFLPTYIGFLVQKIWVIFFIYSDNLCVLIAAFKLLTFKVFIDWVGLIPMIFSTVSYLFLVLVPILIFHIFFLAFVVLFEHFVWFYFSSFLRISVIISFLLLLLVVALQFAWIHCCYYYFEHIVTCQIN